MKKWLIIPFIVALVGLLVPVSMSLAATPPLVPFDTTWDLFVLDAGSSSVLRIDPATKAITVEFSEADITAVTGQASAAFSGEGIAFDAAGNMYFAETLSGSVLKATNGAGLAVLTSAAAMQTATGLAFNDPGGLAMSDDGFLYLNDDTCDCVLRIDTSTGAVSVYVTEAALEALQLGSTVDLNSPIVGAEGGVVYTASDGVPDTIFAIAAGGVPSVLSADPVFSDLDVFMTRHPSGDLIIGDNAAADTVRRVTPAGVVSTYITEAALEALISPLDVDLEGGNAFDISGNTYLAVQSVEFGPAGQVNTPYIFLFDTSVVGSVWLGPTDFSTATGVDADLNSGIAFAPSDVSYPNDPPPPTPTPTPTPPPEGCNFELEPTLVGTNGDDVLVGTNGDDVIDGKGGDDLIKGKGGNDVILGGKGNDDIRGGNGDDCIDGGKNDDLIRGNKGDDTILGGNGDDDIRGNAGADTIDAGNGDDTVRGGKGNDDITGGNGEDDIRGNAGADTIDAGKGNDTVSGGKGNDDITGGKGNDTIAANAGADVIDGGKGNDDIKGGKGNDTLDGAQGNDSLNGQGGFDTCLNGETVTNCEA